MTSCPSSPRRRWATSIAAVGFNSTRRYRDGKGTDVVLLVVGLAVLTALALWGFGII